MTPAARIQAVIELLEEIMTSDRPADLVVRAYVRNRRFIGSGDRADLNDRIYHMMRNYHRLGWWVKEAGCKINARNLVIANCMFEKYADASSVDAIFSGGKYTPAALSKKEWDILRKLEGKEFESPDMPLRERTETPEWAFDALKDALGDDFEEEMSAMLTQAPMDLRVNIMKSDRETVLKRLKKEGLDAELGELSPWSIRVHGRPRILQHPLFLDGTIEIQDEGSQMVAVLASTKAGDQVIDFCAGAGGKTLALAATMENKGRVVATDISEKRLAGAKKRFKKAGLNNIETRLISSERDKWVKRQKRGFDLVLIDAPCTGIGTWRRDPDKHWRQMGPKKEELLELQQSILESAFRLVKEGGRLVYATCSLLPEENEMQIANFISEHPEFQIKGDFLKLTPAKNNTDGFFAAELVRVA